MSTKKPIKMGPSAERAAIAQRMLADAAELAVLLGQDEFFFEEEDHHGITTKITVELSGGEDES